MHDGHTLTYIGSPEDASVAVLTLHGRGDSARGILGIAGVLSMEHTLYAAPEAEGNSWYPHSFLMPLERNEPYLSSALEAVGDALGKLEKAGFARENIVLLGFSQGACLALEYSARNATRYGGVIALSGGLIGPEGTPRDYAGSLDRTPVFLGCSDVDAHIPEARVMESAGVMNRLGGDVDARIYPGMGHTVNEEELAAARAIIENARNRDDSKDDSKNV